VAPVAMPAAESAARCSVLAAEDRRAQRDRDDPRADRGVSMPAAWTAGVLSKMAEPSLEPHAAGSFPIAPVRSCRVAAVR
jgi:hypothetical protein